MTLRAPTSDLSRRRKHEPQYVHLTEDRHQQALYRLAAVGQYLYDTMNGDAESDRATPDPLPLLAMEQVREVQRLIDLAIKHGQLTRRRCLGGDIELIERLPPLRTKYRLDVGRTIVTWLPGRKVLAVEWAGDTDHEQVIIALSFGGYLTITRDKDKLDAKFEVLDKTDEQKLAP